MFRKTHWKCHKPTFCSQQNTCQMFKVRKSTIILKKRGNLEIDVSNTSQKRWERAVFTTSSFINSLQTSGTEETSCWAPQFICTFCRWIVFISINQCKVPSFLTYYRYSSWVFWAVNINNIIKYKIHETIHNIYLDFRIQFLALVLKMSPVPIRKKIFQIPTLPLLNFGSQMLFFCPLANLTASIKWWYISIFLSPTREFGVSENPAEKTVIMFLSFCELRTV